MRNVRLLASLLVIAGLSVAAQNPTPRQPRNDSGKGSFAEFRKGVLDRFNKFRNTVLEDYDKFLQGVWDDYDQMRGKERSETPKPQHIPVAPTEEPTDSEPTQLPTPVIIPDEPALPEQPAQPTPPPTAQKPTAAKKFVFPFYGMEMEVADFPLNMSNRLSSPNDFANQWRTFSEAKAEKLLPGFREVAETHSLNDYLTFRLIRSYINERYPNADATVKVALEHYLLCNMGLDVRIAIDNYRTPMLLINTSQSLYARQFMKIGGANYYLFRPDGVENPSNARISTCRLPSDSQLGKAMDLRIERLNLPAKDKEFKIEYDDMTISGTLNENMMNVVHNYPQMDIRDYATSTLDPELRKSVVKQFKEQLQGMDRNKAIDKLLQFVQKGFEYATDHAFHGFEKPYFVEETLYYPKCDCEDRAIFYGYMLWNALGVENHLLQYPGHESASVVIDKADDLKGTSYTWGNKTFYISDPTYIGSVTGMCMPTYRNTQPKIDFVYQ